MKSKLKIAVLGPESTGKTYLTKYLADYFQTLWLPEYARYYVKKLDRTYNYSDVIRIAKTQIILEKKYQRRTNSILFLDTELIITKIWFQEVYKKQPIWLEKKIMEQKSDLYLLCDTSIKWKPDKVRENGGERREFLFERYKSELEKYNLNYKIITMKGQKRLNMAVDIVENWLENK